jgi:hypothetical protein
MGEGSAMSDVPVPKTIELTRKFTEHPSGRRGWSVVGQWGGLTFWCCPNCEEIQNRWGERHYGGVESHYNAASKPDYLDDLSRHAACEVNGGECWHDGTSLWASEYWIPYILPGGDESIYCELERHYAERMRPEKQDA